MSDDQNASNLHNLNEQELPEPESNSQVLTELLDQAEDGEIKPEHELHEIIKSTAEELEASGSYDQIAAFLKLRYAHDVKLLVDSHALMKAAFVYVASVLNVALPVTKIDHTTGEIVSYNIKVTDDGVYNRQEIGLIGAFIRKNIDAHFKTISSANGLIQNSQNIIERQAIDLKNKDVQIRNLLQKAKYPTIETKAYVLAYLGNKGNFLYLANKPRKDGKGTRLGKSLDFSLAKRYSSPQEALIELILLLKNTSNTVPSAAKLQVFSANLIPATIDIIPNGENMEALRERAEKYETLLKATSGHGKKRKKSKIKAKR